MIKAIFFDVDGTLVSHKKREVPMSTRRVLGELKERGIKCVLATGRHMSELPMLPVHDISFDGYITLNGQLCLDDTGEVYYSNPIVGADKEYILRLFHEKVIPVLLIEKEKMYMNFVDEGVKVAQQAISTPIPDIGNYNGGKLYQAVVYAKKEEEKKIADNLAGCKVTRWNEFAVDIICGTDGKKAGIKKYLEKNNISLEETMAFGDGENDIEMLEFVHIGIVMGNAEENVKIHADFVTDSVENDGIEKVLAELEKKL